MIDANKKNTLCVYAHGGICMSTDGLNKPCCTIFMRSQKEAGTSPIRNVTFGDPPMWNENHGETDWWKSLRDNLDNGIKDPRCDKCWDQEAAGIQSMRLGSNERLENDLVTEHEWSYVDLKLGSKCNLMCNMCEAASSSLIAKEKWNNYKEGWWHKAGNRKEKKEKIWADYKKAGFTDELQWWQNPAFYDKLKSNAEHIRTLKFTGGEPTLIPQVHEVMDYMLETGHSAHIELSLTTNGTYKGTDIYEKMCQFKSAKINLSVDGTDANYNYIRYPHTWEQRTRNTKQLLLFASDIAISYQFTVSVFNLFNIREFEKWAREEGRKDLINLHSNFVYRPKCQNVRFLPDDTIQRAVDYLEGGDKISKDAIKHITNGETGMPKEVQWAQLKDDTELKDRLRPKRPNWDSIDNNMLRLKDLFHGR